MMSMRSQGETPQGSDLEGDPLTKLRYSEEHVRRSTGGSIVNPWHRMERRAEG
jgi:hypothetical protein